MINPAQLSITQPDGTIRKIIIEPILSRGKDGHLQDTRNYKLYKDAFGDETVLFTEPRETDQQNNDVPDEINPDYLGKIIIYNSVEWHYEGDLLSETELLDAVKYIWNNK